MDPSTVNTDTKLARVQRTMQLTTVPVPHATADEITLVADVVEKLKVSSLAEAKDLTKPNAPSPASSRDTYSNIFVVGDCADAFGAIPAGHTAFNQVGNSLPVPVWPQ
jgi:apoptosis-inducing factor 2